MLLTVLTPVKKILEVRAVSRVQVRLADGLGLGIYPGHAPLLAETAPAPLFYTVGDEERELELEAGILHILAADEIFLYVPGKLAGDVASQEGEPQEPRFERLAQTLLSTLDGQTAPAGEKRSDEAS